MRRIRHEHFTAVPVTLICEIRLHHQDPAQLALRPRRRHEAHRIHARDLRQRGLKLEQDAQRPLNRLARLVRVHMRVTGKSRDVLVHLRVVLHRARPKGVEARVDAVVEPAEPDKVPNHLVLRHLGQVQLPPPKPLRKRRRLRHVERRQDYARPSRPAAVERQLSAGIRGLRVRARA